MALIASLTSHYSQSPHNLLARVASWLASTVSATQYDPTSPSGLVHYNWGRRWAVRACNRLRVTALAVVIN
jgi:hypothetical protein